MECFGCIIETFLYLVMSVCRMRICTTPTACPRFELIMSGGSTVFQQHLVVFKSQEDEKYASLSQGTGYLQNSTADNIEMGNSKQEKFSNYPISEESYDS